MNTFESTICIVFSFYIYICLTIFKITQMLKKMLSNKNVSHYDDNPGLRPVGSTKGPMLGFSLWRPALLVKKKLIIN